jgi:glycosyltransferase involved in cell wall biosynthesis
MRLLFVHPNFPGQYKHLVRHFSGRAGYQVVGIGALENARNQPVPDGLQLHLYPPTPGAAQTTHHYLRGLEAGVRRGQSVACLARNLRRQGFIPDVICVHPGWGDGLYLKDIFPDSKMLGFFEFFYTSSGSDVGFDPEFPIGLDDICRVRTKNSLILLSLDSCDWGVTPTQWQHSQHPLPYRNQISTIFDGIDTRSIRRRPGARIYLDHRDLTLTQADEVLTFVNRNLEPYRGFHSFMRALPGIQRRRPRLHTVIVGGDSVSYGRAPTDGRTWRQVMLAEVGDRLDFSRLHFFPRLPYRTLISLFQVSSVHVYLTYPFVLSWSMMEAMSAGCAVVGSRTAPVMEVIKDGENGLLVDFFAPEQIADAVDRVLDHPNRMQHLRDQARKSITERYDLHSVCLPRHVSLVTAQPTPPRTRH